MFDGHWASVVQVELHCGDGVGVAVGSVRVKVREQAPAAVSSTAFGLLSGAFGEIEVCLN